MIHATVDKPSGVRPSVIIETPNGNYRVGLVDASYIWRQLQECIEEIKSIYLGRSPDDPALKERLGTWNFLSEAQRWHMKRKDHTETEVDCMTKEEVSGLLSVYVPAYYEEKEKHERELAERRLQWEKEFEEIQKLEQPTVKTPRKKKVRIEPVEE